MLFRMECSRETLNDLYVEELGVGYGSRSVEEVGEKSRLSAETAVGVGSASSIPESLGFF